MVTAVPLFSLLREGIEEICVWGEIVAWDGNRILFQAGDAIGSYPARSLLKPFQFLATDLFDSGNAIAPRWVPALGSVSGTWEQVLQLQAFHPTEAISEWLDRLILPPVPPWDEKERVRLKTQGETPTPFHHMCFSKHLAILAACEKKSWHKDNYATIQHPYHQRLLGTLKAFLGDEVRQTPMVKDGCGLPSPVLSLAKMAQLYQGLVSAPGNTKRGSIAKAMAQNPEWIGGPGRTDTLLVQKNPGKLIAKEGADGLLGIGVFPTPDYPQGLGIAVKIAAGFLPHWAALAVRPLLEELSLVPVQEPPKGQIVQFHFSVWESRRSRLYDVSPLLSNTTAVWPGDVAFQREVALDTNQGAHLTLSSVRTTVHIGAHTDAPNHFEKGAAGIDGVPLDKYLGPCQVLEIKKAPNSVILPEDLLGQEILARRVLFKTGSFPDPTRFNDDFVALSKELIEWLSERGVFMVGIDTPSIDPACSKTLPAHHATTQASMAILEGVDLSAITPGLYHLQALPLKILGADASPVRAVLSHG